MPAVRITAAKCNPCQFNLQMPVGQLVFDQNAFGMTAMANHYPVIVLTFGH